MIVNTIQTGEVMKKLLKGEVYEASYDNASFKRDYKVLANLLWGDTNICPIFGAGCGKSDLFEDCWNPTRYIITRDVINIKLEVPDSEIIHGEFYIWSDVMYYLAFAEINENYDRDSLKIVDNDEITQQEFDDIVDVFLSNLQENKFEYMQIILKYIKPEWVISYEDIIPLERE